MTPVQLRVEVLHGVNLDQLGRRDPEHYGTLTLAELERQITVSADELAIDATFFHTNSEAAFVERLHGMRSRADGLIINAGAWTHYSYAIRDALEIAAVPAVEVHLSDVTAREPFRSVSVICDLCLETISGRGADGYRQGLIVLRRHLDAAGA